MTSLVVHRELQPRKSCHVVSDLTYLLIGHLLASFSTKLRKLKQVTVSHFSDMDN